MSELHRACASVWLSLMLVSSGTAFGQEQKDVPVEAAPTAASDTPTLFGSVGRDLRGLLHGDALRWLVAGSVVAGAGVLLDDEIASAFRDQDPDASLAAGDALGEAYLHIGAPLALYAVGRLTHREPLTDITAALLQAQIVNAIPTRALKLLRRPRPGSNDASYSSGSFPSGHTSAAFATATVLHRRWGWRASLPAYLVASYVGVTRLQNAHYFSDVISGAAIGVASGLSIQMPTRRVVVTPLLRPGGAGISVELR